MLQGKCLGIVHSSQQLGPAAPWHAPPPSRTRCTAHSTGIPGFLKQDEDKHERVRRPATGSELCVERRHLLMGVAWVTGSWDVQTAPTRAATDIQSKSLELQKAYDGYANTYDQLDGGGAASALGFDKLRGQLLATARGEVVEVAVGTGLNLQYYQWGPQGVQRLLALDLSQGMLSQAQARVSRDTNLSGRDISFKQADATALPLPDASADCLVDTFSLCVIPDPAAAIREMARVVKREEDGGRVLLLEHSKSDNPLLGAYQDFTADAVAASAKGCVWNQDIPALLKQAGLTPVKQTRHVGGTVLLVEAVKRV